MVTQITDTHFEKLLGMLQSEYQALKAEQTSRISVRENAFMTNFLAIGVVATISFMSNPVNMTVLLLIPLISACICWVYLNNDIMVSKLQAYFTSEFPGKVVRTLNRDVQRFSEAEILEVIASWEHYHRSKGEFRKLRKMLNTLFVFVGFIFVSVCCIVANFNTIFSASGWYTFIGIFDILLIVIIFIALIVTKDW